MNLYAFWNEFDQQLYSYPRKLKIGIICVQNQWEVVHPWHGTVANLWGRHKDFTEFNENFEKSYLLNGLSNIVKFFTVWFLKIFCIIWIHIFFWVQCSFKRQKTQVFLRKHSVNTLTITCWWIMWQCNILSKLKSNVLLPYLQVYFSSEPIIIINMKCYPEQLLKTCQRVMSRFEDS